MFISRKTQRLYVRRPFQPILESPVTILDPDRPIGTHVFTAMERINGGTHMRWSAVTVDEGHPHADVVEPKAGRAGAVVTRSSRCRRTRAGRRWRSTGLSFPRTYWNVRGDGIAPIFLDHFGRGVELGDRQKHGFVVI